MRIDMHKYKRTNVLNIVMITDENYVCPTCVALRSIDLARNKKDAYKIYILTNNVSSKSIERLRSCSSAGFYVYPMPFDELLHDLKNVTQDRHVTYAALLKFFLPDIFKSLDKILYLDSDVLILRDITDLWNTDISGVYAAVVKDVFSITNRDYMNNLGIRHEFYFNSGVMLLNLAKMRDDKIPEKLLKFRMTHDQVFMDQDAFNAVIGNNVLYLPWWYNFLNCYLEYASPQQLSDLFTDDFNKSPVSIYTRSTILHLGGAAKPWMQDMGYLSKLYKRYYKRSNCKKYPLSFGKRHHSLWWHLRHWKF